MPTHRFSRRFDIDLATNDLTRLRRRIEDSGANLIDLTVSNPTAVGLSYPGVEILEALRAPQALVYEPQPFGLLTAREAVAAYHGVDTERTILTASTSEGYGFAFKLLCDAGDEVLVPAPSYPLFDHLARMENVVPVAYPLFEDHGWWIDFAELERRASSRARAVVVVHPNNPTGIFLKLRELEALRAFCSARGLALISDEVFADYAFEPDASRAGSLTTETEVPTIVLSGLSKIAALPQMKLGWMITGGAERWQREARERLEVIADTYLSISAPVQFAALEWLRLTGPLRMQILERAKTNLAHLRQATAGSPATPLNVEGGWSVPVEIPRNGSEEDFCRRLIELHRVVVQPGYFFDFPREAFVVLSLLTPEAVFHEGVARMLAALD